MSPHQPPCPHGVSSLVLCFQCVKEKKLSSTTLDRMGKDCSCGKGRYINSPDSTARDERVICMYCKVSVARMVYEWQLPKAPSPNPTLPLPIGFQTTTPGSAILGREKEERKESGITIYTPSTTSYISPSVVYPKVIEVDPPTWEEQEVA